MPNCELERKVVVRNADGLHMRPAMAFVDKASNFQSRISVTGRNHCADGKSIMQVTMLAATQGTELTIKAEGEDAEQAIEALAQLIEQDIPENTK